MEKIEYSDLNKFLVSIGITLIAIASVIPWLYLREPFDLNIEESQIQKLTESAQLVISKRQDFILYTINYIGYISIGLLCLGLGCIALGIRRWDKKQKDLDKRDEAITKKHEAELKQLTKEEIENKAEKELETVKQDMEENKITPLPTMVKKNIFVPKYLQLERLFFEKLMLSLYPDFKVWSNNKIDDFEYDIILESSIKNRNDYIFEIKYFPKEYSKDVLQEAAIRLGIATKHYINKTKRAAKPILVIVSIKDIFGEKNRNEFKNFTKTNLRDFRQMTLVELNIEEINDLSKEQIIEILNFSDEALS
jgi:hypothetical protein